LFEGSALFSPDLTYKVINPPSLKVPWGFLHLIFEIAGFQIEAVTESSPRICFTQILDEGFELSRTVNADEF